MSRGLVRPLAEHTSVHGLGLAISRTLVALSAWASTPSTSAVAIDVVAAGAVRGEWIRPRDGRNSAVVLYVHGGGFVLSSPAAHRAVTVPLACAAGIPVFSVGYRRAPEHRFPAAADDIGAAYDWLLASGYSADRIIVAGDSVGGHMIAALLVDRAKTAASMPAGAVLFSPWLSLQGIDTGIPQARRDPFLSPRYAKRCVDAYLGDISPAEPKVAPLLAPAAVLRRFPPILSVFGGTEYMCEHGRLLHSRLIELGVASELDIVPGQIHDFVLFGRWLPEGSKVLSESARFIQSVLGTTPPVSSPSRSAAL